VKSMRSALIVLWVLAFVSGWAWGKDPARGAAACTSLFFSEYVEGSGYNKGVEIFNGLGQDIDLTGYEIRIYRNGGDAFDRQIPLSGMLSSGDVFVVAHSSAAFDADLKTSSLDFNGDDGVALVKDGAIIDFIGDTLGDPGSEWGSGDVGTKDHTLRRKPWVAAGDANPNDPFDPAAQWDGFPRDTFDGLDWHVADCAGPAQSPTPTQTTAPPPPATSTPTPSPTATSAPSPTPISGGVFINEYMPAPPSGQKEYIELYNANSFPVDVSGWQLDDIEGGTRPYALPAGSVIPPRGFLLFQRNFGLNNGGDQVRLLAPDGSLRDSHAYDHARKGGAWSRMGDGAAAWTEKFPPSPGQPNRAAVLDFSGHLYLGAPPDRRQVITDHNIGLWGFDNLNQSDARWLVNGYVRGDGSYAIHFDTAQGLYLYYMLRPAPCDGLTWNGVSSPNGDLFPPDRIRFTVPASGTYPDNDFWMAPQPPTPTPLPAPFVAINEIMPAPKTIDFDGDGQANYLDEYIELYNPTDAAIDLGGWWLDDKPDGGSSPWRIPEGTVIPARGFLLFFRKDTGIALNNDADSVRLLAPDQTTEADRFDYDQTRGDTPWSRMEDGVGAWTDAYPPSPGGPNLPPSETPTPTPTMPGTPTATPTPTLTPTPTPSPTAVPPGFIALNEFLPAPKAIDFNGDGEANLLDEYIELYNPNDFPVALAGWTLDDRADGGSRPWRLPEDAVIAARGFLLFFRAEIHIALNNDADSVRLLAPDGREVDAFAYNQTAADTPWARVEDGVGGWTMLYPPSPGGPNIAPTPTPTPLPPPASDQIALNEILPAPKHKDWDGDGAASYLDEWIELAYWGDRPVEISGWRLWRGPLGDDGLPTGYYFQFPPHTIIQPHSFPLIFRRQSKLRLPASHGVLHLVRPDGDGWQVVDAFAWNSFPDYDRSFSRYPDGTGPWLRIFVTPGQPNRPFPTPPPAPPPSSPPADIADQAPQPIQAAYQLPTESRLTVEGVVTVPPGVFHPRVIVIQDADAGLMVYLRQGQYPDLVEGDRVRASGYLKDFHGQRELVLPSPKGLTRLGPGTPVAPQFLRTGLVADGSMAQLLRVAGRITKIDNEGLWLDDGSGPVRVEPPFRASWRLPALTPGMTLSAIGVLTRYDDRLFIQLRRPADLSPPPGVLPVTGAAKAPIPPDAAHLPHYIFEMQCAIFQAASQ